MSKKALSKSELNKLQAQKEIVRKKDFEEVLVNECEKFSAPLTGINYRNLPGDKVIITGFYGFLTLKEIKEQYGEDVSSVYEENDYRMVLQYDHEGDEQLRVYEEEANDDNYKGDYCDVYVGEILSNENFSDIISTVKKCGKYLHDLKLAIKSEEKVIGI